MDNILLNGAERYRNREDSCYLVFVRSIRSIEYSKTGFNVKNLG